MKAAENVTVDDARLLAAIAAAEQRTSGEIRVVISRTTVDEPVAAAERHFERLGMTRTADRNGVLILFCPRSRAFAVIGDRGIHEKCGQGFWHELTEVMTRQFKAGDFTGGLVLAIERAGSLLAVHFPRRPDDRNELPDTVERP